MSLINPTKFLTEIEETYKHSERITEKDTETESKYLIRGLSEDEAYEISLKFISDTFENCKQFKILLDFGDSGRKFEIAYYNETDENDTTLD